MGERFCARAMRQSRVGDTNDACRRVADRQNLRRGKYVAVPRGWWLARADDTECYARALVVPAFSLRAHERGSAAAHIRLNEEGVPPQRQPPPR